MAKPISPLAPAPIQVPNPAPQDACDTHVHLLGGRDEFALFDGRTEDPAQSYDAYLAGYKSHLASLGISRGVIVQSIFYGTDNTVTAKAVSDMGANYRGVGLLPDNASEKEIDQFAAWNMKAVRLNYVHGGVLTWNGARAMAPALAARDMHIQMLIHADLHMTELAASVAALPVPVVFDHSGWPSDIKAGTATAGFQALCRALADGHAYVKLSGLYRLANAPYTQTDKYIAALVAANPERCLWGSDWPHIMLNGAEMPHNDALWAAFHRAVPDAAARQKILVDNPAQLYGF